MRTTIRQTDSIKIKKPHRSGAQGKKPAAYSLIVIRFQDAFF